jgi:hypothetical protein
MIIFFKKTKQKYFSKSILLGINLITCMLTQNPFEFNFRIDINNYDFEFILAIEILNS